MQKQAIADKYIDSMDDIAIETLRPDDIAILGSGGNGTARKSGEERVVVFRTGYITPIGNINTGIWDDLADAIILAQPEPNEDAVTLEALDKFIAVTGRKYLREHEKERHHEALTFLCARAYEDIHWDKFIAFNTYLGGAGKERLLAANPKPVLIFCCGKRILVPNRILQESLAKNKERPTISCPSCGKKGLWIPSKI